MKIRAPRWGVLLVAGLTGCGFSHGFIRDSTTEHSFRYEMNLGGIRFVKAVYGSATHGLLLCIIPLSGDMYRRAMEDLYAEAQLQPNQIVVNLREDHSLKAFLFFYCSSQVTVSGDVIELTPAGSTGNPPASSMPLPFPSPPPPPK